MTKRKILPWYAVKYFVFLIIFVTLILHVIDRMMPQYALWKEENNKILNNMFEKRPSKFGTYPLLDVSNTPLVDKRYNVLVIGDSFIEGDGYTNINVAWWRQLQLELYDRGYYEVNIIPVGKCGASTYDEVSWMIDTSMIKDIDPDLIIIGYVDNDPIMNENGNTSNFLVKRIEEKDFFDSNAVLSNAKKLFPNLTYKINNSINYTAFSYAERYNLFNDKTGYMYTQILDQFTNEPWKSLYVANAVKPLSKYLNQTGIPYFVVNTAHLVDDHSREWLQILSLFKDNKVQVYEMIDDLKNTLEENPKYSENRMINPVNTHPGTFLTKYYAEYIADILENDYKAQIGKKYEEKIEYPISINDTYPYTVNIEKEEDTSEYVSYQVSYDNDYEKLLYMPIKKSYMKLSLEYPIELSKIEIEDFNSKYVQMYLTNIDNDLGYDTQKMINYGKKKGNKVSYDVKTTDKITSINIHMDKNEDNKTFKIKIYK